MGFFSKKEAPAETLPTSTPPAKAAEEPKKDGIFCGMSLSEALIAVVILLLFFFFVIWPLITAYFMLACLWIVMWPFVKFIPSCANHKYVGPMFTVLSVVVTSPIKVSRYLWKTFKSGKHPEDKPADPVQAATEAAAQAVVQQAISKV